MPNAYFVFKKFRIDQAKSGMKVTTDACLFGGWVAYELRGKGEKNKNILDIGTGTGLLALMLAQQTDESKIDAIEINEEALMEASINFQKSPWNNRLTGIHISLQNFISHSYDTIVCNPPFFMDSQLGNDVNKNQAIHSTFLSADQLLQSVSKLLSTHGTFYLLYPEREMNVFIDLSKEIGLMPKKQVWVRNQVNQSVFRIMAAFGYNVHSADQSALNIRTREGKYTSEFWSLLKDYYLEYNDPER